ncbi:MAG TPA: hypothetical protein VFA87_00065, partial [Rhizomicrobium sp.]|nr:hypothetical protein [Rhizomicrobium sp.]
MAGFRGAASLKGPPGTGPGNKLVNPILLIPARLAATRLPAKPLADIGGVPMIVRVVRQAMAAAL